MIKKNAMKQFCLIISISLNISCAKEMYYNEPIQIDGHGKGIVLPFKEVRNGSVTQGTSPVGYSLFIPCHINEREGDCLFDTGAGGVSIYNCFADISRKWASNNSYYDVGGSGVVNSHEYRRIAKLKLGNASYEYVLAEFSNNSDCSTKLGIIGRHVFKKKMTLNMDQSIITDQIDNIKPLEAFQSLNDLIIIELLSENKKITALVDTGAQITIIDTKKLNTLAVTSKSIDHGSAYLSDHGGHKMNVDKLIYSDLTIAGIKIDGVLTAATNLDAISKIAGKKVDLILGMNAIRKLNWSFDFETNRYGVWHRTSTERDSPPNSRLSRAKQGLNSLNRTPHWNKI